MPTWKQLSGASTPVTKESMGMENADNTSDVNKPVSTLQQAAIAAASSDALVFALLFGAE